MPARRLPLVLFGVRVQPPHLGRRRGGGHQIRADGDLGLLRADAKTEAIAAELMFAAGKLHALAGYITANTPDDLSVNLAEDFANRMDRICLGYLNFPAEGITYPDTPLFRFD